MSRQAIYSIRAWLVFGLMLPAALVLLGVGVLALTESGEVPFDNPDLWWLVAAVPFAGLLQLFSVWRKRRGMDRFMSRQVAPLLADRVSLGKQACKTGLLVCSVVFLIAAILGPRWGIYLEKEKVRGVDIVAALDVSRSMLANDVKPNRLRKAKELMRQQLTERAVFQGAHRLGLLAFAGSASVRLPLTTDHLAFRSKLDSLRVGGVSRGGTDIGAAIVRATDLFAKSPEQATKIILLFTDGEDLEGRGAEAARQAYEEYGIQVFAIGIGDPTLTAGARVPSGQTGKDKPLLHDGQIVFSKVDTAGLRAIAETSGGRFAMLDDLSVLVDYIANMRGMELSAEERMRHKPRYQWLLLAALILLGTESLLGERKASVVDQPKRIWQQEVA